MIKNTSRIHTISKISRSDKSLTKKVRATQNFIKDKMTGRSIHSVACLWKVQKSFFFFKSNDQKNYIFGKLLWKRSKIVIFWVLWLQLFWNFLSNAPKNIPFRSSCIYKMFCSSNIYTLFFAFFQWLSAIYKSIILDILVNLPLVCIYNLYKKGNKNYITRRASRTASR